MRPWGRRPGDFALYFAGQLISTLGSAFTFFALPLLVYTLTESPTDLALTMAANRGLSAFAQ